MRLLKRASMEYLSDSKPYGTIEYYFVKSSAVLRFFHITVTFYNIPSSITIGIDRRVIDDPFNPRHENIVQEEVGLVADFTLDIPSEYLQITIRNRAKKHYVQTNTYRVNGESLYLDEDASDIAIQHVSLELMRIG